MSKFTLKLEEENQWEELMQEGYTHSMNGDSEEAIRLWNELWIRIHTMLLADDQICMEDIDSAFQGMQAIYNWASDFEMELGNAAKQDKSFAQIRIDYCSVYIERYKNKSERNLDVMKWAICESHYDLGEHEAGELLFQKYLEESPKSGWGWIAWADQYGVFAQDQNEDKEKAIHILKQALSVEGLQDRMDVLERLDDLYLGVGKVQESADLQQEIQDQMKAGKVREAKGTLEFPIKAAPVTNSKMGRNDPCSCGSGLKYKKCCGK